MKDKYQTVAKQSQGLYKEKGSKFLSFVFPVSNEEEIKQHQAEIRKAYYDARHHVFAWRLGVDENNYRASDDGEPANSSGMPVLGQIRSFELSDILIIVVRYFGGTKLGVPGLINAYKTAAKNAIEQNQIVDKIINNTFRIAFNYDDTNTIMRFLKEQNIEPYHLNFQLSCELDIDVRLKDSEKISNLLSEIPNIKHKQIS
ncbi:MAG: YigZ family protein [Bacteroidales bacterium]|nr:YigZ family protein [Bacteroidales bacterium]